MAEMTVIDEIVAERVRQIEEEGWTLKHDAAEHWKGELLTAATFYYLHAKGDGLTMRDDGAPLGWPWDAKWWKPKTPRRDLIRAGALCLAEQDRHARKHRPSQEKLAQIVAEIERLDRIGGSNA